ncbi:MAG TPA: hypothetical protein VGG48_14700 [Rhizomicrobium sp.]
MSRTFMAVGAGLGAGLIALFVTFALLDFHTGAWPVPEGFVHIVAWVPTVALATAVAILVANRNRRPGFIVTGIAFVGSAVMLHNLMTNAALDGALTVPFGWGAAGVAIVTAAGLLSTFLVGRA